MQNLKITEVSTTTVSTRCHILACIPSMSSHEDGGFLEVSNVLMLEWADATGPEDDVG
jgi:hypothetical protein